ncbi:MAG: hypothetical protein ACQETI_10850 [Halobacteriota archaeon]
MHRILEGSLLTALYATDAALGIAGAVLLAAHAAAETTAMTGLCATTSRRWGVTSVVVIPAAFLFGAMLGDTAASAFSPPLQVIVLSIVGGVLVAAGVATKRRPDTRPVAA